jgi:acetyltransferase-like isoleucine patch superfamily enzyme
VTDTGQPNRRRPARVVAERIAPVLPALRSARRAALRESFVVRLKLRALSLGATLDLDVAADLDLAGMPSVEIYPNTWNRLHIGAGVTIGDGVRISMRGGCMTVGPGTDLRRMGNYQVAGELQIGAGVVMSTGVVVHCAESIRIDDLTIIGEYTTIADSAHVRTAPNVPIHHASETAPVVIGSNVWIGAHAVVVRGVTVGAQSFVGAGAVVTRDVPEGWLVGGVPAKPLRELTVEP